MKAVFKKHVKTVSPHFICIKIVYLVSITTALQKEIKCI